MRLLKLLMGIMFFTKFIVPDDVGGGAYDNVDIDGGDDKGDNDLPPQTNPPQTNPPPQTNEGNKDDNSELLKKLEELENKTKEQEEFIAKQKNQEAINEAIGDIKTRHNDFDEKKVLEHLKELNKTNPQKAAELNNPVGWENIWYQIRPQTPHNDNFRTGRNTPPVNRDDEVFSLVKSGGATLTDELDVVGKYL